MNETEDIAILLVEDDLGHADLVKWNLEKAGINNPVFHAKNGREALRLLIQGGEDPNPAFPNPDNLVMLLDINMPIMDGHEVLQYVRSHPRIRYLPIVMFTTAEDRQEVTRCHELGCNLFLQKSVNPEHLTTTIQHFAAILPSLRVPVSTGNAP